MRADLEVRRAHRQLERQHRELRKGLEDGVVGWMLPKFLSGSALGVGITLLLPGLMGGGLGSIDGTSPAFWFKLFGPVVAAGIVTPYLYFRARQQSRRTLDEVVQESDADLASLTSPGWVRWLSLSMHGRGPSRRSHDEPRRRRNGEAVRFQSVWRVGMLKRFTMYAGMALSIVACESQPPAFSPAPESYSESQVMIAGVAEETTISSVDSTFFGTNQPMLGRLFIAEEYGGESLVTVLSHGFWVDHFGERPEIIGSHLDVGGEVRTVVGIMPRGVDVPEDVALWIPRERD